MIENIEGLHSGLQRVPLCKPEDPAQSHVRVYRAGPTERIASKGAVRAERVRLKRLGVQPLDAWSDGTGAARGVRIRQHLNRPVLAQPGEGIVLADN